MDREIKRIAMVEASKMIGIERALSAMLMFIDDIESVVKPIETPEAATVKVSMAINRQSLAIAVEFCREAFFGETVPIH